MVGACTGVQGGTATTSFSFSGRLLPPHDSIRQIPIQFMQLKQYAMPASQHHNNIGGAHSLYPPALQQSVSNSRVVIAPDQPAPCKKRRADILGAIPEDKRCRGCDRDQPIDISSDTSDSDSDTDDSESMGCRISVGRKHSRAKDLTYTYSGNAERYSISEVCVSRLSHEANYISNEEDADCSSENSKIIEPAGSEPVVARVVVPPPFSGTKLSFSFSASARNCIISLRPYLTNISQTVQTSFLSW